MSVTEKAGLAQVPDNAASLQSGRAGQGGGIRSGPTHLTHTCTELTDLGKDGDLPVGVILCFVDGVQIVTNLLFGAVQSPHLTDDIPVELEFPASVPTVCCRDDLCHTPPSVASMARSALRTNPGDTSQLRVMTT
ncbi:MULTISPECIES: hypothetical protein [unclassified Luteococcus]|uniref:hypothetical protein n=1 Tax=unclassified Luteococcus TaxID=2639923 RepID=UPI00313DD8B6